MRCWCLLECQKTWSQPLTRSWKLSSAPAHQRSHVQQAVTAVYLENDNVALSVHVADQGWPTDLDEEEEGQWTKLDIHMDTICEIELYCILVLFMYFKMYCIKIYPWIYSFIFPCEFCRLSCLVLSLFEGCSLFLKYFKKLKRLQSRVKPKWAKIIIFTF